MKLELLAALNAERAARRAAIVATDLATGAQRLVTVGSLADEPLAEAFAAKFRAGKSGMIEAEGQRLFATVFVPPAKLVIVGAVHVSQALVPMARLAGYDPVIVDPRTAFATEARFPDVEIVAEWPDQAAPIAALDAYTAFVALTHDPKIDDPALTAALKAECFYIGALGSRRTHAKRVERLAALGFSPDEIARIKAPIGLDIGAVSPAEIAVSILAEIIETLRRRPVQ